MEPVMSRDQLQDFLRDEFPQMADVLVVEAVGAMTARIRRRIAERDLRPGGTVSGPTIFELADAGFYLAVLAMIGPQALTVTTNAAIDFMRKPAADRDLVAEARILKLGRVLAVGDVLVCSDGVAEPVARASLTYSIPPAR